MEARKKREAGFVKEERLLLSQGKDSQEEKNLGGRYRNWKELILDGFDFLKKGKTKSSTENQEVEVE